MCARRVERVPTIPTRGLCWTDVAVHCTRDSAAEEALGGTLTDYALASPSSVEVRKGYPMHDEVVRWHRYSSPLTPAIAFIILTGVLTAMRRWRLIKRSACMAEVVR
jgi:hypothetical protein